MLIGGLSVGTLVSCGPKQPPPLSSEAVYTNNCYVPGVGYYHAPFRAWFALPYNHFDPQTQQYFCGGQWAAAPFESITNISTPVPGIVPQAEARRTDVVRGGFGRTSSWHGIHS